MKNIHKKVSIIGAGMVGSNIAYSLMLKNLVDEIVLIDVNDKLIESEILDIKHGLASISDVNIHKGSYGDIKDIDLIIITAGKSRKANQTRLDIVIDNINIAKNIADNIKQYYNKGIVIIVSNPVDIVTYQISKILDLPKNLVFGTGCMLDTSRFIFSIADYINCDIKDINGFIIGEHGDSQLALWSKVKVCDLPIDEYCKRNNIIFDQKVKEKIEQDVAKMGAKIIAGKGKTHYGISTCVSYLADSILNNLPVNVSVSSCLNGEYGLSDVALSLPSVVSEKGLERLICEDLTDIETNKLISSANSLKNIIAKI